MFEVFDPKDGKPIFTVEFQFVAELLCWCNPRLDFDLKGEGWPPAQLPNSVSRRLRFEKSRLTN